jgi:G3E family GTPase
VSKTDLADSKATGKLIARLKELNPRAIVDTAISGELDPDCLIDSGQGPLAVRHDGFVAEASHSDGIASFVLREDKPVEWPVFHRTLETLIALRGPDLLRVKGLLSLKGSKGPVVFQAVQHLIHPPVELNAWPDRDHATRIVFITRGVSEEQVRDLFAACKALGFTAEE